MTTNDNQDPSPYAQQYGSDQPAYGQPPYPRAADGQEQAAPAYGQQQAAGYGQYPAQPYGQQYPAPAASGQPSYPLPSYEQPGYPQPSYEQPSYPQPGYGQPGYGQQDAGQYGAVAPVQRPGGVLTAAVLGFVWGALGAVATVLLMAGGALFGGVSGSADNTLPGLGSVAGAAAGVFVFLGILALAWTVVMLWGSAWALSGRSRVMLIVGGSIAIATTGFTFFGSLSGNSTAGGIVAALVLFLVSILIVVLLARKDAAAFYAARRALRARR